MDAQLLTLSPQQLVHSECVYSHSVDVPTVTVSVPGGRRKNGWEREETRRTRSAKRGAGDVHPL